MIAALDARPLTGRRVLLAVCCLLAVAASASAEAAWVLWVEETWFVPNGPTTPSWTVVQGFKSVEASNVGVNAIVTRTHHETAEWFDRKGDGNRVTNTFKDGRIQAWRYVCLPDTVDPRGPKGK